MTELEKVIKGANCCITRLKKTYTCGFECPYKNHPLGCKVVLLKDVLSIAEEQEPRIMKIEELEKTDEPVFIELRTKDEKEEKLTCFGLLESLDDIAFHFIIDKWLLDGKPYVRFYGCVLKRKEYSIDWRAWNKKPTIEQMKDVKWND